MGPGGHVRGALLVAVKKIVWPEFVSRGRPQIGIICMHALLVASYICKSYFDVSMDKVCDWLKNKVD